MTSERVTFIKVLWKSTRPESSSRIANLNFRWYQFASLELCTLSGIDLNLEIGPSRITRSAPYHYYIENTFDSECIE